MPFTPPRPQPPQHTTSLPSSTVPPLFFPEAGLPPSPASHPTTAPTENASRPLLLRPVTTGGVGGGGAGRRPVSLRSVETSTGSDFSLGLGGSDDGNRPGKAVRFGEGAKANRTATQSMADFLRNVPPPEVPSPTRSAMSAPEKTRKASGRLFGLGRLGQKDTGSGEEQRTPSLAPPSQMTGLQKVITPSGQTVHIIIPRPSPGPSFGAAAGTDVPHQHSSGASTSSAASENSSGPPVLPELRTFSDDERDHGHGQRHRVASSSDECRADDNALGSGRTTWSSQASETSARQHSQQTSSSLLAPPPLHHAHSPGRSASAASQATAVPQIVIPTSSASTESSQQSKRKVLEREALTLELLGQRIERDAQGELVLSRRVSKRTVGAQTNISAVRSLLELSRERTTTNRSTRSTESGTSSGIPPSPALIRGKTLVTPTVSPARDVVAAASAAARKRNPSIEPDASLVGGESDEDQTRSATSSAGTFGPRSPGASSTASGGGASQSSTRLTPPPLVSHDSRASVSSAASGSSWSVPTPSSTPAFGSLSPPQSLKSGGGMRKATSGSRLRPSTAPTSALPSPDARDREALESRLKASEERLAQETERRREAERRLKRLQVSSREGRARWEDMAGWAVEVIESADKDRHLLGLENARLQRTLELYRAHFGDYELAPSSAEASD